MKIGDRIGWDGMGRGGGSGLFNSRAIKSHRKKASTTSTTITITTITTYILHTITATATTIIIIIIITTIKPRAQTD